MNSIIVALALFGVASCGRLENKYIPANTNSYSGGASQYSSNGYDSGFSGRSPNADIPVLRYDNDNNGEGTYNYAFETGNNIQAQEQGQENDGNNAQGSFSYISPEGEHISMSYSADGNGFNPQGSHIPTAPPVPAEILKALEQNAAEEARGIFDDGQYRGEESHVSGGYSAGSKSGYQY